MPERTMESRSHSDRELALIRAISKLRLLSGAGLGRLLRSRSQGQTLIQALLAGGLLQPAELERAASVAGLRWLRCRCGWESLEPADSAQECPECGGQTLPVGEAALDGPVPASIGAFEILGLIGRGGMGQVLRARDPVLDREIALKVLASGQSSLQRFEREGRLIAALNHPYIVKVYGFGVEGRQAYLAMDHVEGSDLDRQLEQHGPLTPDRAAALVQKVASAVAHAHERGVVHRDLKPANILIDGREDPRVVDFGLALPVAEERITAAHRTMGTPAYMAPEQIQGAGQVDHRCDVYALGVVLYRCLSGRPPFEADSVPEMYHKILHGTPPPLSGVPPTLSAIVAKAMERDPASRYQQAAALARDLEAYLRGGEVSARPLGPLGRLWRGYRANLLVSNLLLALLASLLGLLGFGLYSQSRRARLAERYLEERDRAQQALASERAMRRQRDEARRVNQAERLIEIAIDLERADASPERIRDFLEEADRLARDRPRALRLRGLLALKAGQWKEARALLLRSREANPRDYQTHFYLYRWYLERGRGDDPAVVAHIARVATYGGDTAFGWWGKACVTWGKAVRAKGPEREALAHEALEQCDRALARQARFVWAVVLRAQCHTLLRRYDEALADHGKVIALSGGKMGHNDRGVLYRRLGQVGKALADFGEAIRRAPANPAGYINRGRLYRDLRRYREALADYDKAVALGGERLPLALNGRGLVHAAMGQKQLAVADYARAIALDPKRSAPYTNRGALHASMDRPKLALADFARAIALRPEGAMAYFNRGLLYKEQKRVGLAIRDLSRAIQNDPRMVRAYTHRIKLLREARRFEEALADADVLVRLTPNDALAHVTRAGVCVKLGRLEDALKAYGVAIRLSPMLALPRIHRGLVLAKMKRYEEAVADLEQGAVLTRDQQMRERTTRLIESLRKVVARRKAKK